MSLRKNEGMHEVQLSGFRAALTRRGAGLAHVADEDLRSSAGRDDGACVSGQVMSPDA
jgi:hypothetical protein